MFTFIDVDTCEHSLCFLVNVVRGWINDVRIYITDITYPTPRIDWGGGGCDGLNQYQAFWFGKIMRRSNSILP